MKHTLVTSLTPAQHDRMASFAQEWIEHGWRTQPLTEEEWAVWEIQWACNPKMLRTALDITGLPVAANWTGDPIQPVTLFSDDGDTQVVFMGVRVTWS